MAICVPGTGLGESHERIALGENTMEIAHFQLVSRKNSGN